MVLMKEMYIKISTTPIWKGVFSETNGDAPNKGKPKPPLQKGTESVLKELSILKVYLVPLSHPTVNYIISTIIITY